MNDSLYVHHFPDNQGMVIFEVIKAIQVNAIATRHELRIVFIQKEHHPGLSVGDIRTNIPISLLRPITPEECQIFKAATRLEIPLIL